jgi:hypothetical protein
MIPSSPAAVFVLRPRLFLALLLPALLAAGCNPARRIAADHGFYSSGNPSFSFTFDSALTLAGAGGMLASVPSDTNLRPAAAVRYAVFAEEDGAPRHAHALICSLPDGLWQWEKESWPHPASLSFSKSDEEGKFWTIQIFPLPALSDWFSAFRQANGRENPRFWLLKRWSATPLDSVRILAEYREPAPACMEEALQPLEDILRRQEVPPPGSAALWGLCSREIQDFSARADAAVSLRRVPIPLPAGVPAFRTPDFAPHMKRLAGVAELSDQGDTDLSD